MCCLEMAKDSVAGSLLDLDCKLIGQQKHKQDSKRRFMGFKVLEVIRLELPFYCFLCRLVKHHDEVHKCNDEVDQIG